MAITLGPILGFRGAKDTLWNVSVLVAIEGDEPPTITLDANAAQQPIGVKLGNVMAGRTELTVWRYDCAAPQTAQEYLAKYSVDEKSWSFTVPAADVAPRIAYGSCNGFSSLKLLKNTKDPNGPWRDVMKKHGELPFHLLLLGGDQVYSDSIWEELRPLADWAALPTSEGIKKVPSANLLKQIRGFYEELYVRRWKQQEPADVFASIPTVMMWDDHDIFDGWGSYSDELQRCKMYKALFFAARDAFTLYQQQLGAGERHPLVIPGQNHFSLGFRIGNLAFLALDMRSEREESCVISQETWKAIFQWLDAQPKPSEAGALNHLFVLSSIPVVYPDFQLLENALGLFPGRQELEDDLRDHWNSAPHRQERLRLIHRLLAFSEAKQCRVTILSGDVHVGAVGVIRSERGTSGPLAVRTINQLTSSGLLHPAPPGMVLFFLEQMADKISNDDSGVTSQMVEIPGTHHHFLGGRNWLSLQPDKEHRYWANWFLEGEKHPYTKVIHPIGFEMTAPKMPQETFVTTSAISADG